MEWSNLAWPAQPSQFTASSLPLPNSLCQLTIAKSLQDNSTLPIPLRDNSLQAVGGRAGWADEQAGGQSGSDSGWGFPFSHTHTATMPSSSCSEFGPFDNGSSGWDGQQGGRRGHMHLIFILGLKMGCTWPLPPPCWPLLWLNPLNSERPRARCGGGSGRRCENGKPLATNALHFVHSLTHSAPPTRLSHWWEVPSCHRRSTLCQPTRLPTWLSLWLPAVSCPNSKLAVLSLLL